MEISLTSSKEPSDQPVDDRATFAAERKKNTIAMGRDSGLFKEAADCVIAADSYRYSYLWSWMGLPIIQMPSDIVAMQEIIWKAKPDVIIETGIARGGSLILYASILELLGKGKVIGVDIDLRAHNRDAIETHPMSRRISLIDGSSTDPATVALIASEVPPNAAVMVVLDSDHSKAHVLSELRALAKFVTTGQYLVVADTLLGFLEKDQTPRARAGFWPRGDEPLAAVHEFLKENSDFVLDEELDGKMIFSSSRGGYLYRVAFDGR